MYHLVKYAGVDHSAANWWKVLFSSLWHNLSLEKALHIFLYCPLSARPHHWSPLLLFCQPLRPLAAHTCIAPHYQHWNTWFESKGPFLKTVKWSYHYAACPQSSNLFLNCVISNCTNKTEQQYAWILSSVHSKQWSKTPQYPTYTNLRAGLVNTQIGIMVLCSWMECPTKAQDTAQHKVICYIWSEQKDTSIFYMHNWKNLHRLREKKETKPKLLLILSQARLSVRILNSFRAMQSNPGRICWLVLSLVSSFARSNTSILALAFSKYTVRLKCI